MEISRQEQKFWLSLALPTKVDELLNLSRFDGQQIKSIKNLNEENKTSTFA